MAEAEGEGVALHEIDRLTRKQCERILKEANLPKSGKLAVLRDRLRKFLHPKSTGASHLKTTGDSAESKLTPSDADAAPSNESELRAGSLKKRKKWRVTDPAEIAPNYYHEDLFKTNFPLVDVIVVEDSRQFPVNDKFAGVTLDSAVTREARREWSKRLVNVSCKYKTPESEKQAVAFHLALIEEVQPFTNPAKQEIQRVRQSRVGRKRKWDNFLGDGDEEEHFAGFRIEADVQGDPNSFDQGMSLQPEASATLAGDLMEHEDVATGFSGSVLRIHDYRPLERAKTSDEAAGMQTERVAAVVARKFAEDESKHRAVWQGGYYSVKYAELNLQHGHGTPLYILVQTSHSWTYALLVPEGYVQLLSGGIDPACKAAFEGHQKFSALGRRSTLESLSVKLEKATIELYRKNFRDNPAACYRDGPQLVGKLYVRDAWFPLPTADDYGFAHRGARRLFDGLLRLVVGDSVLKMSSEDLMRRVHLNQEMESVLNESVHGDD